MTVIIIDMLSCLVLGEVGSQKLSLPTTGVCLHDRVRGKQNAVAYCTGLGKIRLKKSIIPFYFLALSAKHGFSAVFCFISSNF